MEEKLIMAPSGVCHFCLKVENQSILFNVTKKRERKYLLFSEFVDWDWNPEYICENCYSIVLQYSEFCERSVLKVNKYIQLKKKMLIGAGFEKETRSKNCSSQYGSALPHKTQSCQMPSESSEFKVFQKKNSSVNMKEKCEDVSHTELKSAENEILRIPKISPQCASKSINEKVDDSPHSILSSAKNKILVASEHFSLSSSKITDERNDDPSQLLSVKNEILEQLKHSPQSESEGIDQRINDSPHKGLKSTENEILETVEHSPQSLSKRKDQRIEISSHIMLKNTENKTLGTVKHSLQIASERRSKKNHRTLNIKNAAQLCASQKLCMKRSVSNSHGSLHDTVLTSEIPEQSTKPDDNDYQPPAKHSKGKTVNLNHVRKANFKESRLKYFKRFKYRHSKNYKIKSENNQVVIATSGNWIWSPINCSTSSEGILPKNVIKIEKSDCGVNTTESVNNDINLTLEGKLHSDDQVYKCEVSETLKVEESSKIDATEFLKEHKLFDKSVDITKFESDADFDVPESSKNENYLSTTVNNFSVKKFEKSALRKIREENQPLNASEMITHITNNNHDLIQLTTTKDNVLSMIDLAVKEANLCQSVSTQEDTYLSKSSLESLPVNLLNETQKIDADKRKLNVSEMITSTTNCNDPLKKQLTVTKNIVSSTAGLDVKNEPMSTEENNYFSKYSVESSSGNFLNETLMKHYLATNSVHLKDISMKEETMQDNPVESIEIKKEIFNSNGGSQDSCPRTKFLCPKCKGVITTGEDYRRHKKMHKNVK